VECPDVHPQSGLSDVTAADFPGALVLSSPLGLGPLSFQPRGVGNRVFGQGATFRRRAPSVRLGSKASCRSGFVEAASCLLLLGRAARHGWKRQNDGVPGLVLPKLNRVNHAVASSGLAKVGVAIRPEMKATSRDRRHSFNRVSLVTA
jgi:hypothetical protein